MQIDIYQTEHGAEELAAFCRDMVLRSYSPAYNPRAVEMLLDYHNEQAIRSDLASGRVWAAREGGELVGTVTLANNELSRMFVWPRFRGHGVGAALALQAIASARETGMEKLTAWSVPFSRGFYAKLGFVVLNADTLDFTGSRETPVPYLEMALWLQGAPEVAIFRACPTDATEMLAGQREAFREQCELYDDWRIPPVTESAEDFAAFLASGGAALKAVSAGRIIGGVRGKVVNGVCEVGRLWVSPGLQGRHVACRLMAALEERFPECLCFQLYTGEQSHKNISLYMRQGYSPTGRRAPAKEPGSPGNYDLVWLEKPNPWPEIDACARRFRPQ